MTSKAELPDDYIESLPDDRKQAVSAIREAILTNIPDGFREEMSYGMLGYVVPHSIYPAGYHCTPKLPLPFMNVASQKNFISVYYMGFANNEILEWFKAEYPKYCKTKLDLGKSCIRLKKINDIPVNLIGELASKMTVQEWIDLYEKTYK